MIDVTEGGRGEDGGGEVWRDDDGGEERCGLRCAQAVWLVEVVAMEVIAAAVVTIVSSLRMQSSLK